MEKQSIVSKTYKVLTPEYLEWHTKLTELPSILTDKMRSKLYKRYKKKTGFDSWISSKTSEYSQTEIDKLDSKLMDKITELKKENIKIKTENIELKQDIDELKKEIESKKNCKFPGEMRLSEEFIIETILEHDNSKELGISFKEIVKEYTTSEENKILTPEYYDWYNKLIDLPSILTDKFFSRLYKRETGKDP
ncbi:10042_t:CDS:2 [Racocetra fulgida]|uniref:10042_t:CDS:1 n=1 Tax=Racocetra fulgida TaxID=60492 RepID=A0A9N9CBQ1_9GLOM|nr:10042_t:CDS:2 [Racocetra fulgida]